MNYNWDWSIFLQTSPNGVDSYAMLLARGLLTTIITASCAWVLAFVLGSICGIALTSPVRAARNAAAAYVEIFRNIPCLVQLFLWYFVLPELLPSSAGIWLKQLPNSSFWTAVIGLGCYMSARVAEQVRSGISSLPKGQSQAAAALGLSTDQSYRYVLLPSAYRIIFPALTSEFINTIKNTSVALTIGLMELTARTREIQEFSFQIFEAFTAASVIYLLLNLSATFGMRALEKYLARSSEV